MHMIVLYTRSDSQIPRNKVRIDYLITKNVGESWGNFVTEGSSVPHGLGQVCRREEPLSY